MTPVELCTLFTKIGVGLLSDPPVEPEGMEYQKSIMPIVASSVEIQEHTLYSSSLLTTFYLAYACARAQAKRLRGIVNIVFPSLMKYDIEAFARLVVSLEDYASTPSRVFSAKWLVEECKEGWSSKTASSIGPELGTIVVTRLHEVLTDPLGLRVLTEVMALVNIYEQGVILLTHKPVDEYPELEYKGNVYQPEECLDVGCTVEIADILRQSN